MAGPFVDPLHSPVGG